MALALVGMLAGALVGQVGAFQFPRLAFQQRASQQLVASSDLSSESPVLSSFWSPSIKRWEPLIVQEANRRSLDPDLVAALMWRESRGDPSAIGPNGSVGLLQIMPKEAGFTWRPSKEILLDPSTNLFWGTRTLSIVIQQGDGDVFHALAAYNGGWDQVIYRRPRLFAMTVLRDYAHAVAARCGTNGRWLAFFAVKSSYIQGPIWVADSDRSDVYFYGQTNALPDGTALIADIAPTSVVARFTSEVNGTPHNVGIWLYNADRNVWDPCASSRQVTAALPPTAVPTATPGLADQPTPHSTPTSVPQTTPTPTSTPMEHPATATASPVFATVSRDLELPSVTPTFTPPATPAPGGELVAALDGVVLDGGAALRPGATFWWHPSTTLLAGTAVRVLGYDPETPEWVYVSAEDGRVLGWAQVANLRIPGALQKLALITPVPTLTPTPTATLTPTPTATVACDGGSLRAEAWALRAYRSPLGGWIAVIYTKGYGGNCEYTYVWNVDIEKGPMFGSTLFELKLDRFEALVGAVTVISGDEQVEVGVFVPSP